MAIHYIWIEQFRGIEKQGFCFSPDYDIEYLPDQELKITPKEKPLPKDFWNIGKNENQGDGANIFNVNALIGKNGAGKSSVIWAVITFIHGIFSKTQREGYPYLHHEYFQGFVIFKKEKSNPNQLLFTIVGDNIEFKLDYNRLTLKVSNQKKDHNEAKFVFISNQLDYWPLRLTGSYINLSPNSGITFPFNGITNFQQNTQNRNPEFHSINQYINSENNSIVRLINYAQNNPSGIINELLNKIIKINEALPNELIIEPLGTEIEYFLTRMTEENHVPKILDEYGNIINESNQSNWQPMTAIVLTGIMVAFINYFKEIIPAEWPKDAPEKPNLEDFEAYLTELEKTNRDKNKFDHLKMQFEKLKLILHDFTTFNANNASNRYQQHVNLSIPITEAKNLLDRLSEIGLDFFITRFIGISTGEASFLRLCSRIFDIADGIPDNTEAKEVIFLMDEPTASFHPEWERRFLGFFLEFIPAAFKEIEPNLDFKFQFIIASHSPFLLSDIPIQNIEMVPKGKKENNQESFTNKAQSFGGNIHNLLANNFFLKSTIGEFAKVKIDDLINYINNKKSTIKSDQEAQKLIDLIGEPLLRRELERKIKANTIPKLEEEMNSYKQINEELKKENEKLKKKLKSN